MRCSLVGLTLAVALADPAYAQTCDRECLRASLTQYLNALAAHDTSRLRLAPGLRFTEDNVELKPGEGLWKTAGKLTGYRQDFLDVREGNALAFVLLDEGEHPVMYAVRLKVNGDRQISEIETMAVRSRTEGMIFQPSALKTPSAAMNMTLPADQRNTREQMVTIAMRYPAGLKTASFVTAGAQFAPEAYRFENGQLMAGPGCTFIEGCQDIRGQRLPRLSEIRAREIVVDEEAGIVVLRMDFGKGSTFDANTSLNVFEAFKIYGGQIHAVEALMEQMPYGARTGWEDRYPLASPSLPPGQ